MTITTQLFTGHLVHIAVGALLLTPLLLPIASALGMLLGLVL